MKEVATTQANNDAVAPWGALRRDMNRLFEDFGSRFFDVGFGDGRFLPEADYAETDKEIVITTELPGVDAKDLEITLADNILTIRGEKKSERDDKNERYQFAERTYGAFERSISVPEGVDPSKVDAKFDKGVLKLTMPKPVQSEARRRKIEIKAS